jgi:hypothetical protein
MEYLEYGVRLPSGDVRKCDRDAALFVVNRYPQMQLRVRRVTVGEWTVPMSERVKQEG